MGVRLGDLEYGVHFIDRHGMIWLKTLESQDLVTHSVCILVNMDKVNILDLASHYNFEKFKDMPKVIAFKGQPIRQGCRILIDNEDDVDQLSIDFWLGDQPFLSTMA